MRKLAILLLLASTAASAAEAPKPSAEEATAETNRLLVAVSTQRDACVNREARMAAEIDRLTHPDEDAKGGTQ